MSSEGVSVFGSGGGGGGGGWVRELYEVLWGKRSFDQLLLRVICVLVKSPGEILLGRWLLSNRHADISYTLYKYNIETCVSESDCTVCGGCIN